MTYKCKNRISNNGIGTGYKDMMILHMHFVGVGYTDMIILQKQKI